MAREVVRVRAEDVPTYYANNVGFRVSLWDFTMDFGSILEASEQRLVYRDDATVIMSPQHALVFSELLIQHIARYQEQYGPIPKAPDAPTPPSDSLSRT